MCGSLVCMFRIKLEQYAITAPPGRQDSRELLQHRLGEPVTDSCGCTATPDLTGKDDSPSTRVPSQPFRDCVKRNPGRLNRMWLGQRAPWWGHNAGVYIVVPSQCYRLWRKTWGSTSGNVVLFWREGVHYSEEYVLFVETAAMHHTEQRTSSPLMRTAQPENCTTPWADMRKPALVILADSDHRSLEILPVCQILHHRKRHLRANAVTTCF